MNVTPMPGSDGVPDASDADAMATNIALAHRHVVESTRRAPHIAIAVAVALGVVLGGGIPSWVLRLAAGSFVRLFAAQVVHSMITPSKVGE